MRKMSRRLTVLAIACAVFAAGFGTSVVLATYTGGDYGAHKDPVGITNAQCEGCHGRKALQRSLDPFTFSAHKRHLYSAFMRFQVMDDGCITCHESTDLWEGSGATLRKQVDVAFCVTCHGQFTTSLHGDVNWALTRSRGCTADGCHPDPASIHEDVEYVNKLYTRSRTFCTKCHGGLAFYPVEETN